MTFDEIVADVCGRLDLTSPDAITRVGLRVNRRYRRITSSIGLMSTRRVSNTFVTAIGTRVQSITGVEKIFAIQNADIPNSPPLRELLYEEMLETIPTVGPPTAWAVRRVGASSVVVVFDSSFAVSSTLTIDGEETASTLSGTQIPAFPESFHDVLVFGALADELRKKEKINLARDADSEYDRILGELRLHIALTGLGDIVQGKQNISATSSLMGAGGGDTLVTGSLIGNTLGPENRDNYAGFPSSGLSADAITSVLEAAHHLVPTTDNTLDLGYTGTTNRRFRNGLFSHLVQAAFLSAVTGLYERLRSTAVGEWVAVPFAAGNFTASAGLWTLTSPDQVDLSYTLVGKTMFLDVSLNLTSVSTTPQQLGLKVPGGFVIASRKDGVCSLYDNGTPGFGVVQAIPGGTTIYLFRDALGSANWSASANNTGVSFQLALEVQ